MTAMTELPFLEADVREIFEIPLKKYFKPRRNRRRILEDPQPVRRKLWCRRMKVVKWESCRSRHQELVQKQVQVDDNPERAQQLCSPVQQEQGGDHLSVAEPLPPGQQSQEHDNAYAQLQRQTTGGGMSPDMGPQQMDQKWEAPEVTVQVRPQKLSQGWESSEVTVQVQPQKPDPRWKAPVVNVEVQLQQQCQGPALPQVTVQVQPLEQGQGMAGVKVTVQLQLGCEAEVTCLQDKGEEMLGNGEQVTPKQYRGEPMARSEGETELALLELVSQGALNQKQDQGKMTKPQQDQSQNQERMEVMKLQEMQTGDKADLGAMVTEEQLQGQSQEQKQLKACLPAQNEVQRATEMRPEQGDVQEGSKEMVEDLEQKESKKCPRETPNYFVSIPITDDQILDRIEDVQELIFNKEPDLLRALRPIQTMHLTLIVAHLGTAEEIKKAVLALKQSKSKVEAILQGKDLNMTFHGIGHFNKQVIYVKMLEEDQKMLHKIAEAVEECFNEMNLDISGSKDFKPHLTFLKLSKAPRLKRRGLRKFFLDLYKEYEDCFFGTEVLSQIDLCAMHKKKQESGYYFCECSINVGSHGMEKSKEQEMQTGVGETANEDLPNNATKTEIGATATSCKLASCLVVADDKLSENIAESSIASKEKETNGVKGQLKATDGTFLAAGEICSKTVLDLLPASSDALKTVEKEQEKAKGTDGNLQKIEVMEYAHDQATNSG